MKIVISIVLAALFMVGCSDSSQETQMVETAPVATEAAAVVTEPVVAQESNETAPVATEATEAK